MGFSIIIRKKFYDQYKKNNDKNKDTCHKRIIFYIRLINGEI